MRTVAISQRVMWFGKTRERRDCLDQRWIDFLRCGGFIPILIPNDVRVAKKILNLIPCQAILLTGGNDLARYGGDAFERDATESYLLRHAIKNKIPLLGVCRGMQVIQNYYGIKLSRVEGHVAKKLTIRVRGKKETVNSYHHFGSRATSPPLETWAAARDGVVKAIRHPKEKLCGIMWHPERFLPFRKKDLLWIRNFFNDEK